MRHISRRESIMSLIRQYAPRKRRFERKPVVEPLESRALLSADLISTPDTAAVHDQQSNKGPITLLNGAPYAGQPWSPTFQYEKFNPKTTAKDLRIEINYGDPQTPGWLRAVRRSTSGKRFVIINGPEHTYHNPGQYTLTIRVQEGDHYHSRDFVLYIPAPSNTAPTPPPSGASDFTGTFSGVYNTLVQNPDGATQPAVATVSLTIGSVTSIQQVAAENYIAVVAGSVTVSGLGGQTATIPYSQQNSLEETYEYIEGNATTQVDIAIANPNYPEDEVTLIGTYSNDVIEITSEVVEINGYLVVAETTPISLSGTAQTTSIA
jgi:hypothetical protein